MGRVLVSLSQTIKKHGWKALSISFTLFVKVTWNEVQNESSVWDFFKLRKKKKKNDFWDLYEECLSKS